MLPLPWCIFFSGWIQWNALWRISNSSSKKNYAHIKSLIGPFSHWTLIAFSTLLRRILGLKIGTAISVYWLATFVLGFFVIHTLVGLGWDQYYYVNRTANTSSMEPGTAPPAMQIAIRERKKGGRKGGAVCLLPRSGPAQRPGEPLRNCHSEKVCLPFQTTNYVCCSRVNYWGECYLCSSTFHWKEIE